jgi:Kef-type K+ transport system membrane component KefB
MNFAALNRQAQILAAAGAGLFATLFAPWFRTAQESNPYISPARDITLNAWEALDFVDVVLALTAVAAVAAVLWAANENRETPRGEALIAVFLLTVLSAILVVAKIYDPIDNTEPQWGTLAALGVVAVMLAAVGDGARYFTARAGRALEAFRQPPRS